MQRSNRHVRVGGYDLEQRGGGAGGVAAMLFPVLQRLDADAHELGEFVLRQPDFLPGSAPVLDIA